MSRKAGKEIPCDNCGNVFYQKMPKLLRNKNNFCSFACANKFKTSKVTVKCSVCGKNMERVLSHVSRTKNVVCGIDCMKKSFKGKNHSGFFKKGALNSECINFKEGKQTCNGYIMVLSHEHPAKNAKNYVYEHRLVMEKHIGRYLTEKEVVHHIDFNKKNNDISNLMLFSTDVEHHKYHRELRRKNK